MVLFRRRSPPPPPPPEIRIVVLGGSGVGKSRLVSRLVYDLADANVIRKEEKDNKDMIAAHGDPQTWVVAKLRASTFDRVAPLFRFRREKVKLLVEGVAGQKEFVRNLVERRKRFTEVHVGVVVVAPGAAFPAGAIDADAKQQIVLAKLSGIRNLVIAVNRMDVQRYSLATFNQMKYDLEHFLREIGYSREDVKIIPVSALEGENVTINSGKMRWWMESRFKGQPTLVEAIEDMDGDKVLETPKEAAPSRNEFNLMAFAHIDVEIGFAFRIRILPDNADIYAETNDEIFVADVVAKMDGDSGALISDDADAKILRKGQAGILRVTATTPLSVTPAYPYPSVSRFQCVSSGAVCIAGTIAPEVDPRGLVWRPTHSLERSVFFG